MIKEDMFYCDYCGGANKPSAVICEHCERKMRQGRSAFLMFLKANTKDKLLGDAKDGIFERIKDFLLSHLYGIVVSILVVTTAIAYAVPKDEYISTVPTASSVAVQESKIEPEPIVTELTDEDKEEIFKKLDEYRYLCEEEISGFSTQEKTMTMEDILVDMAGVTFEYPVVHDLRKTGIHSYAVQNEPPGKDASSATTSTALRVNDELTTELGKKLRDDGYEVAENNLIGLGYFDGRVLDFSHFYELSADFRFDFSVVYVKIDGVWYIAEDKLL